MKGRNFCMKTIKLISLLILIPLSACGAIDHFLSSETLDIVVDEPELTSIFLGYPIFTGNRHDFNPDPSIQFDLRHNPRFLNFEHPLFLADEVTDEDIINWITVYLHGEVFLSWRASVLAGDQFDPAEDLPWAIINLDNGNQISISLRGATRAPGDTFVIAYRRQNSDVPHQRDLDWFDIAYAIFVLDDTTLEWQGFVKNNEGNYMLRYLEQSPFN